MSIVVKVAELLVNITANAGGFVKPVRDSRKELKGFSDEAKLAQVTIGGLKSALALGGVTLSFASAIASARSYAQELDALGKVAAKVGVETGSLAALRFGGEQSGLDPRVIDVGLQKLSQRISEARLGTGEAAPVLKELKLDLAELAGIPADKQLERIADAMLNVSNQGDKIRIATKLFEEEGVGMLNLLKDGSYGLRQFREEAKQLGIDFGTDAVAGVEAANDAINRLKTSLGSLGRAIVIELSPDVERVANELTRAVREFRDSPVDPMGMSRNKPNRLYDGAATVGGWFTGLYDSYYTAVADFEARRQIRNGDGAGTPAPDIAFQRARAASLNPGIDSALTDIDLKLTELEKQFPKPNLEKGFSALLDKGIEGAQGWANWAKGDGLKQLTTAAKTIADAQEKIREGLRGAAWESIIRPPGWRVERERHEKDRQDRRKQLDERRRDLEAKLHPSGPTAINSAIERYSAEAYRVMAENKVAKAQLEVARESKRLLEQIDKGIDKIEVTTTGL